MDFYLHLQLGIAFGCMGLNFASNPVTVISVNGTPLIALGVKPDLGASQDN